VPTYEYACTKCGQHVEVFQRVSDEPLTECGVCGGPLRKVFHPAGILFKGSGFYSTDNRSKASGGDGKKSSESKGSETKTSEKSGSEKTSSEKKSGESTSSSGGSGGKDGSSSTSSGSAKERSA